MIKILAIDPGSVAMGWAMVDMFEDFSEIRFVDSGVLKMSSDLPLARRCGLIADYVQKLLVKGAIPVAYAAVEKTLQGGHGNVKSAFTLAEARSAAVTALALAGIFAVDMYPNVWKAATVGNGAASKADIKQYAIRYFPELGDKKITNDQSDAICIAIARAIEVKHELWQQRMF